MNNNDIGTLMKLLNTVDKTKLSQGLNKLDYLLSPEEKRKIIEAINLNNK